MLQKAPLAGDINMIFTITGVAVCVFVFGVQLKSSALTWSAVVLCLLLLAIPLRSKATSSTNEQLNSNPTIFGFLLMTAGPILFIYSWLFGRAIECSLLLLIIWASVIKLNKNKV